jgi:hypothetical protein
MTANQGPPFEGPKPEAIISRKLIRTKTRQLAQEGVMGTWPPGQYYGSAAPRVLERLLRKVCPGANNHLGQFFLQISSAHSAAALSRP